MLLFSMTLDFGPESKIWHSYLVLILHSLISNVRVYYDYVVLVPFQGMTKKGVKIIFCGCAISYLFSSHVFDSKR